LKDGRLYEVEDRNGRKLSLVYPSLPTSRETLLIKELLSLGGEKRSMLGCRRRMGTGRSLLTGSRSEP
jgi:hypothetical protein